MAAKTSKWIMSLGLCCAQSYWPAREDSLGIRALKAAFVRFLSIRESIHPADLAYVPFPIPYRQAQLRSSL